MKKISELTKAEKLALRMELIKDSVDIISTDLYLDGKMNDDGKWLVKENLKGLKMIKKNKGYIYG